MARNLHASGGEQRPGEIGAREYDHNKSPFTQLGAQMKMRQQQKAKAKQAQSTQGGQSGPSLEDQAALITHHARTEAWLHGQKATMDLESKYKGGSIDVHHEGLREAIKTRHIGERQDIADTSHARQTQTEDISHEVRARVDTRQHGEQLLAEDASHARRAQTDRDTYAANAKTDVDKAGGLGEVEARTHSQKALADKAIDLSGGPQGLGFAHELTGRAAAGDSAGVHEVAGRWSEARKVTPKAPPPGAPPAGPLPIPPGAAGAQTQPSVPGAEKKAKAANTSTKPRTPRATQADLARLTGERDEARLAHAHVTGQLRGAGGAPAAPAGNAGPPAHAEAKPSPAGKARLLPEGHADAATHNAEVVAHAQAKGYTPLKPLGGPKKNDES